MDLESFINEIKRSSKAKPKEILDEVVRVEKTDCGKGALMKASDRLRISKTQLKRLGIRGVVRRGGGRARAVASRKAVPGNARCPT